MIMQMATPALPAEDIVDNRVYTDQRLFEAEIERVLFRSWNFVCHESELAEPGDFRTTTVALQPVIVCRNRNGDLRGFYNTCRHRAAEVERRPCGNAKVFTCFYHLWSYDLDGRLSGLPEAEAYETERNPEGLDRVTYGLVPVRVESLHRMVFVCFDENAPSLADYMGEAGDALRYPFGDPDLQVELMWTKTLHSNWKMQPENSRDGYHATLLHKRLRGVSPPKPYRIFDHGHCVQSLGQDYETGLRMGTLDQELLDEPALTRAFMAHPLPGQTHDDPSRIITMFPDLLISVRYSILLIERQIPLSPGETFVEVRGAWLKSDTDDVRHIRQKHWDIYWVKDGGNLQEDWVAWESQQRAVSARGVPYSIISRGNPSDTGLRGDDNRIRAFWAEWRRLMGTDANAPLPG